MAIATLAQYQAAAKQRFLLKKTPAGAPPGTSWWTAWDGSGSPGAGSLSIGSTSSGAVPTDATTGAPTIEPMSGSMYLASAEVCAADSCRWMLYDRLFHAGSFTFNSSNTLTGVPSYSSRVPGGTDFTGLQIWIETASNMNGSPLVTTTYTDQSGGTGHTTGAIAASVGNNQRVLVQAPLASGDCGVTAIESTSMTGASSAGTWNIIVARPLLYGRAVGGKSSPVWIDRTGMPEIYGTSCLALMVRPDASAGMGVFEMDIEIASA